MSAVAVGALDGPAAEDPCVLLPALFGPQTLTQRVITAQGVGAWESTWVAVIPTEQGLFGITSNAPEADQENWAECSPGARLDMLLAATAAPFTGPWPDLLALAADCVQRLPPDAVGPWERDAEVYQTRSMWLLRAALSGLPGDAARRDALTLLALTCDPQQMSHAQEGLDALGHLCVNWREAEGAHLIVSAVAASGGRHLSDVVIEEANLVVAVLSSPRHSWAERARAALDAEGLLDPGPR